jgi:hypothetical protein
MSTTETVGSTVLNRLELNNEVDDFDTRKGEA